LRVSVDFIVRHACFHHKASHKLHEGANKSLKADPSAFGILDMHGLWFIASNIVRDIAALNNREMLPWDVWGAMRRQHSELDLNFLDRLALVSREPDAHVRELSALYHDQRVNVPGTVFKAVLSCPQMV
jgi:hypothetical protein